MIKTMGAYTCRVCGKDFPLFAECHYVARDTKSNGALAGLVSQEPKLYDVFDCPHCGCQNKMGERLHEYTPDQATATETEEDDE
jgi:hypothetical protein